MFPQQIEVHLLRRGFSQSVRSLSYLISPQRTVARIPLEQEALSNKDNLVASDDMLDHDQPQIKSIPGKYTSTDGGESAVVVMESENSGDDNANTMQIDRDDSASQFGSPADSSTFVSSGGATDSKSSSSLSGNNDEFQLNYSTMEKIEQQGDELAWKCIDYLGHRIVTEISRKSQQQQQFSTTAPVTFPIAQQIISDQLMIVLIDQIRTVSLLRLQQLLDLIESILLYSDTTKPHTTNTLPSPTTTTEFTAKFNSNPFVWSSLYDTISNPHGFDYIKKNICISWWLHLVRRAKLLHPSNDPSTPNPVSPDISAKL